MTLENCKRLLQHYENIIDGTISAPFGHKNWDLVLRNAKTNAEEMRKRIERKLKHPKYSNIQVNNLNETVKEEEKKDGKKSKR